MFIYLFIKHHTISLLLVSNQLSIISALNGQKNDLAQASQATQVQQNTSNSAQQRNPGMQLDAHTYWSSTKTQDTRLRGARKTSHAPKRKHSNSSKGIRSNSNKTQSGSVNLQRSTLIARVQNTKETWGSFPEGRCKSRLRTRRSA